MAKSGDENEMMNAARLLHAMMAKYQIDMTEIEVAESKAAGLENFVVDGKYNETWRRTCYEAAAKMFMCNYYFVPIGTKNVGVRHHIIGAKHNVSVAVEMGKYFEATINRLANEASKKQAIDREEHTSRHRFIRSFRLACVNRVYSRVLEFVNQAKSGKLLDPETGKNLPAMLSLYEEADLAYKYYLEEVGITITTHSNRDQQLSAEGRRLGRDAGERVSFSTQITTGSQSHALPSR